MSEITLTFENSRWVCTTHMLKTIDKTPEAALYHAMVGTGMVAFPQRRSTNNKDYLTPEGKLSAAGTIMLDMEGRVKVLNEELVKDYPEEHLTYLWGELQAIQTSWDMQFPHLKLEVKS